MTNAEHYYQPRLTAWGNRCLVCGETNGQGPHIRLTWAQWSGTEPAPQDPNPMVVIPSRQNGKPYDPYGIFPESEQPLDRSIDSYEQLLDSEIKFFKQMSKAGDPFPPEERKGNRATGSWYDEADLVVRGNPRHARERVGFGKRLVRNFREDVQDLKKYVDLSKKDKIVLGIGALLVGIQVTFNILVNLR